MAHIVMSLYWQCISACRAAECLSITGYFKIKLSEGHQLKSFKKNVEEISDHICFVSYLRL